MLFLFVLAYRRGRPLNCVRGKMLWQWRCCYVEDVVMLKMLFRWNCWKCCYIEDVFPLNMLKMLLCWRCCCVEDVATLKIFLHWKCCRCCYVGKRGCAFRPWFSGEVWHFYRHAILLVFTRQPKMKNWKNLILIKTADNIPQACCPRVEVVQCVIMFHEDHQTL